jgi:hypothetical protein
MRSTFMRRRSLTIDLQRTILDTLRYNVPLDPFDLVGRSWHPSDNGIKGAK